MREMDIDPAHIDAYCKAHGLEYLFGNEEGFYWTDSDPGYLEVACFTPYAVVEEWKRPPSKLTPEALLWIGIIAVAPAVSSGHWWLALALIPLVYLAAAAWS